RRRVQEMPGPRAEGRHPERLHEGLRQLAGEEPEAVARPRRLMTPRPGASKSALDFRTAAADHTGMSAAPPVLLDKAAQARPTDDADREDGAPSSIDPAVCSVTEPTAAPRGGKGRLLGRIVGVLLVLGGPALFVTGLLRGDRS